ncbi:histidinol dehydrogenase [Gemmatimonadota bacterium]
MTAVPDRDGPLLRRMPPDMITRGGRTPVDGDVLRQVEAIINDVRERGDEALLEHAIHLGDLDRGAPLIRVRSELESALSDLPAGEREVLERTAERIERFARAQRDTLRDLSTPVPGGSAGHTIAPVQRVGCYAPGGRYPLLSSALMTVVPARVAGVKSVSVASPRPGPGMLAASAIAGADSIVAVGGAQAIAALAYGTESIAACDVIVGPGNCWVTAAKQIVSADVKIDMLAGPSELVIMADDSSDPTLVAADLLAQAEHDPEALPILVTLDERLIDEVERELGNQLVDLPSGVVARQALANGYVVMAPDLGSAIEICNHLAPEHLQLMVSDAGRWLDQLEHYGSLFIGSQSAEVLGDYGLGPNHVLPTGGTARFTGGLSVITFLRIRTWLKVDGSLPEVAADDIEALARIEGLEAHARAAAMRRVR